MGRDAFLPQEKFQDEVRRHSGQEKGHENAEFVDRAESTADEIGEDEADALRHFVGTEGCLFLPFWQNT